MATFQVELKRVVDDSYPIEIGFDLMDQLVEDMKNGLLGGRKKLAVITDSEVEKLYAEPIARKLEDNGFIVNVFAFPAGEKSKTRQTKEIIEDAMLAKEYRRDCGIIAVGGGVVTDLAGFIAPMEEVCRLSIMRRRCLRQQMLLSAARQRLIRRLLRI